MSTNIINRALIKIGEPTILSIDQTPHGAMMGVLYDDFRKTLLSSHYWRFAIKRATLAQLDVDTNSAAFNYAYALPADFLTLKEFGEGYKIPNQNPAILSSDARYSIENGKLLCKQDSGVTISYVANIKDTNLFTPLFREALVALIAAEASVRIKNSPQLKQLFMTEFDTYLNQARVNNEIMRDMETMPDNTWVTCREGWEGEY